jgi:hypothetical protein
MAAPNVAPSFPQRPDKEDDTMTREQRASYNAFARDFLTFNLELDHLVGRETTADVWPYSGFNRKPVETLLREFDAEAPPRSPSVNAKRRRGRGASAPAQVMTLAVGVEFVPDELPEEL